MQTTPSRSRRGEAWASAKQAVRAYSRNPSTETEMQVQEACLRLRRAAVPEPGSHADARPAKAESAAE